MGQSSVVSLQSSANPEGPVFQVGISVRDANRKRNTDRFKAPTEGPPIVARHFSGGFSQEIARVPQARLKSMFDLDTSSDPWPTVRPPRSGGWRPTTDDWRLTT